MEIFSDFDEKKMFKSQEEQQINGQMNELLQISEGIKGKF